MKIAIASGKGGTGKTFVSTNLFWVAQKAGMPVTLVDCDAEEPNVAEFITGEAFDSITVTQHVPVIDASQCIFCGKCAEFCSYNAIICIPASRFILALDELCHDCGACTVACESGAITEKTKKLGTVTSVCINSYAEVIEACMDVGVYSPVPVIKTAINEAGDNALILLDSPPGISCPFVATIETADFVVLVTEPTPFGLHDLKLSIETLQHLGKPFGVVLNRAGLGNNDVVNFLVQNGIPLLEEIPFDKEIARIYAEGLLLVNESPEYRALFVRLLHTILNN